MEWSWTANGVAELYASYKDAASGQGVGMRSRDEEN
jgi:hypothetical protein